MSFWFRIVAPSAAALVLMSGCGRLLPDFAPAPSTTYPSSAPRPEAPLGGGLVDQAINQGTRSGVVREGGDLGRCLTELSAARVTFSPTPDRTNSASCGLRQAGVLGPDLGTTARLAPGDVAMTCQLALALSIWRRQSLEPAAREILGSDVVQIDHFGAYACRNVNNGVGSNRISAHSQAAAFDFAGVRLRDGRRISLTQNWSGGSPEAR
ncbi:hypothetical protein LTR94_026623, partial [Friedmanniomyces endolithicus]